MNSSLRFDSDNVAIHYPTVKPKHRSGPTMQHPADQPLLRLPNGPARCGEMVDDSR